MLIIQRPTVEAIGEEEANRQRFAVSPLEPGFGHTLPGDPIHLTPAGHQLLADELAGAITRYRRPPDT